MKPVIILVIFLLFLGRSLNAQTRTIQGRVVSEHLEPLGYAFIQGADTTLLGKTDINGRYKIEVPQQMQVLRLTGIGLEDAVIKLKSDCDTLEIIMLYAGTYDFETPKQIERHRLKQFNKLPKIHLQAFNQGIFSKSTICYSREFKPDKPYFDEVKRQMVKKKVELKQIFEKVTIGDTIKIPFNRVTIA